MLSHFSHVQLCATLWTVACQAPLSMGFSRQEHWSRFPCPPPRNLPNPGSNSNLLSGKPRLFQSMYKKGASPVAQLVKNLPADAGNTRDEGSITGWGRSPGEGNGTCSGILAWRIPWTEEPGRLQSIGLHRIRHV